ncbi:Aspartic peptidase domain superfamily [Sesbania bispinosa]|nr:Aspartic peptidase domain superfamily [Sesbania bispinosa]
MPPRTKIPTRREASGESASQPRDPLQRGRGRGHSQGRRDVNAGRHGSVAGVANAEVPRARRGNLGMAEITVGLQGLQQVVQQLVGAVAEQQQGNQQQNLDGQQGVRQVDQQPGAMAGGIELEGMAYDWFDTRTRRRSVGSPSLAWGELSRLFMARFLPESVRDGLAHEFERLEQTEGDACQELEQRQKEKGNNDRDSCKKQRVEGSQSSHPSVGVGSVPGYQVQQRAISQRGGSSGQSFGTTQSRRSDQGKSSRTIFPQRHFGVTSTPCPTCGRLHTGTCFGDSRVCVISAARQSGRGSGGRGQAQAGRGQARVFAMTREDAQASNAVVTSILPIFSRDAHVLFDPGATHSFVSLSFATQLAKSPSSLDETLAVTTPVREILLADCVYRSCVVSIGGKELFANLIAPDMVDFDVILGMDWLASHYATLDCHNKVVRFEMPGESAFSFQREQGWEPHNLISTLGASKLMRKGFQG